MTQRRIAPFQLLATVGALGAIPGSNASLEPEPSARREPRGYGGGYPAAPSKPAPIPDADRKRIEAAEAKRKRRAERNLKNVKRKDQT